MPDTHLRTIEEIRGTIGVARDSVWVITDTLQRLENGQPPDGQHKGNLERNVGHLRLVVSDPGISESGEDIQDLHDAITAGEQKLAEDIWPPETLL